MPRTAIRPRPRYETGILGGRIVDGTGREPFACDLAVHEGRCVMVERDLTAQDAEHIIDASGHYIFPGFIDAHSHGEALLGPAADSESLLSQGITTIIIGQDGLSFAPSDATTSRFLNRYFGPINGPVPSSLESRATVANLLELCEGQLPVNTAYLVPLGNIRLMSMGQDPGPPSRQQLFEQRAAVETSLLEGAIGVSTGLDYVPTAHFSAAEIAELCRPVAQVDGVHASHLRGYHHQIGASLRELAQITMASGASGHVSHLRAAAEPALALLDELGQEGCELTFDAYPYTRGATILSRLALSPALQAEALDNPSLLTDDLVQAR